MVIIWIMRPYVHDPLLVLPPEEEKSIGSGEKLATVHGVLSFPFLIDSETKLNFAAVLRMRPPKLKTSSL